MDVVALGLAKADAKKNYASKAKLNAARLLARMAAPNTGIPAVSTDLPTVTWATSTTFARRISGTSSELRLLGAQGTFNSTFNRLEVGGQYSALDFYLFGDSVEINWVEQVANTSRLWVFIDGRPMTATPELGLTTSAGTTYTLRLVWGASARRRITVHADSINGWPGIRVPYSASVAPGPSLPRVAFVGDSFFGGSSPSPLLQASGFRMAQLMGVDPVIAAVGGTGYVAGSETYGSTARRAKVTAKAPELIVFSGSVNDGSTGIQTAAAACFAAYQAALPDVPCIVFGPQPSNATDTISSGRAATIAAVKAAADAASNVIAFRDMVGTAGGTVPPAWVSGATYNTGDLVTYKGSVFRWVAATGSTGTTVPDNGIFWALVTYQYAGTGKGGTTTGDGNRDFYLSSDGVHPTVDGSLALAIRQESEVRAILAAV